ncbi:leukocyte elastase inhibitor-like [Colias croceus]|uniref:leukocyte elastase inhibitor-like n=1 Tax=Colias crocea TaxID=72248 RepID=UPI001E27D025|nr:leukocyte elastase inhibitor-like [Colias croceus]
MTFKGLLCVSVLFIVTSAQIYDPGESSDPNEHNDNKLASGINELGFQLTKQLMKSNGNEKNVVLSPASISGLLAMTLLGSVGEAYDELAQALQFSKDIKLNRNTHERFGELLRALNSDNASSKTLYADVVFADKSSKLREAYREYLKRVYNGNAIGLDFKDQQTAKDTINEWVKENTQGKIPSFLKDSLPVSTKVVLLSALYFSGQWKHPFLVEYTQKLPFNAPLEKTVMVDQMLNIGSFPYLSSYTDDLLMVALPYNDSMTTMYAIKPRRPRKMTLPDLLDKLDYYKIDELINRLSDRKCVIRFPKMDLQKTEKLEDSLKALGIKSIFTPGQANFALMIDSNSVENKTETKLLSRINTDDEETSRSFKEMVNGLPNPGVFVDTILHDVKIKIDEYGTEAVAASGGILARTAEQFYADSPFYIFIRNERTKLVTFSAVVFDPTS